MLDKQKSFVNLLKQSKQYIHLSSQHYVKRKYPINPEEVEQLPVFKYNVSKKSYKRVFTWGNIQTGALGIPYINNNNDIARITYVKSPKRLAIGEKFEVVTATTGFGFTAYAVQSDDNIKVYGTGLNSDSQIGYKAIRKNKPLVIIFYPQGIHLPFTNPETAKVTKLAAGRAHLCILTTEGLFLMGNNSFGQCGRQIVEDENYSLSNYINHLKHIDGKKITDVETGQDHTLAITEDGSVYGCGWGADGQTGIGNYESQSTFVQATGDIKYEKIVKVSSRSDCVLALNDKGEVFGWGNNEYGQLCLPGTNQQVCHPTHLNLLKHLGKVKSVASAGSFCLAVNENGDVFSWGYGLLGLGPAVTQSNIPQQIPSTLFGRNDFQPDTVVEKVTCGLSYAAAITNKGDLYMWGRNTLCCLGLQHKNDQFFPLKVSLAGFVKEVSCGADHTVAICDPFI